MKVLELSPRVFQFTAEYKNYNSGISIVLNYKQNNNAFGNVRLSYSLTRKSTGAFRFKAIKAKFSWRIVENRGESWRIAENRGE